MSPVITSVGECLGGGPTNDLAMDIWQLVCVFPQTAVGAAFIKSGTAGQGDVGVVVMRALGDDVVHPDK